MSLMHAGSDRRNIASTVDVQSLLWNVWQPLTYRCAYHTHMKLDRVMLLETNADIIAGGQLV